VVQSELVVRIVRQLSLSIAEGSHRAVSLKPSPISSRKFRYAGPPMTEATTLPLSAHRDFLISAGAPAGFARITVTYSSRFDKNETTHLAASLGVRVPKTVVVTSEEQARDAAGSMRYPVVLKPAASEELSPTGSCAPRAAPAMQRLVPVRGCLPRYQQPIFGGAGSGVCRRRGNPDISRLCITASYARSSRIAGFADVYPTGSGSAVRAKASPLILRFAAPRCDSVGTCGGTELDGRIRKKEGSPAVFMEVNGRFWHSLSAGLL